MWFYFFAVLFPRLTLFISYLMGWLPTNNTPLELDILMTLFLPRGLLAFWLYEAQAHPLLIGLFVFVAFMEKAKIISAAGKRAD